MNNAKPSAPQQFLTAPTGGPRERPRCASRFGSGLGLVLVSVLSSAWSGCAGGEGPDASNTIVLQNDEDFVADIRLNLERPYARTNCMDSPQGFDTGFGVQVEPGGRACLVAESSVDDPRLDLKWIEINVGGDSSERLETTGERIDAEWQGGSRIVTVKAIIDAAKAAQR